METVLSIAAMQKKAYRHKRQGESIALVPTMGALHHAHCELVRRARSEGSVVIVSIFVNPTQFGPKEDLDKYPRSLESDLRKLEALDVDYVFVPSARDMYPEGFQTEVKLKKLPRHLCGLSRPVHFAGVALVVLKLFNICMPDTAIFGLKDFQQFKVIQRLTADLDLPIRIIGVPTLREADGLAESSRNIYMSGETRKRAVAIHNALVSMEKAILAGKQDTGELIETAIRAIEKAGGRVDYVAVADPETLDDIEVVQTRTLLAAAAFFDGTRLIDNQLVDLTETTEDLND